jgi:hypothetical protein
MHSITACRICRGDIFESIVDFGHMAQGGYFPKLGSVARRLPLHLVQCLECGLVQLGDQLDLTQLYGDHYGYRSGLNLSMVEHLAEIVRVEVPRWVGSLSSSDRVLDIGSNDGTLLNHYGPSVQRVGVDPSLHALSGYYQPGIEKISGFFGDVKVPGPFTVVTSIAMFYDLDDPVWFAERVRDVLANDGIWILEQGYWPELARSGAYDVICHEHIEYYGLRDVLRIMDRAGLIVKDVSFNSVNGGSFRVVVGKHGTPCDVSDILVQEAAVVLGPFRQHVADHGKRLRETLSRLKRDGAVIYGYGASTKGSTVLQHAGIGPDLIDCIVDVSEAKDGCWTPGTHIPIVRSAPMPSHYFVGPWHYRESILRREQAFLDAGGTFIFPLPAIELVSRIGVRTI